MVSKLTEKQLDIFCKALYEFAKKEVEGEAPKENEYRCAQCGNVYEKGWTDEEAFAEKEKHFKGYTAEDCAVVCDDCYNKIFGGN